MVGEYFLPLRTLKIEGTRSSMDRISDSGSDDRRSNRLGFTKPIYKANADKRCVYQHLSFLCDF